MLLRPLACTGQSSDSVVMLDFAIQLNYATEFVSCK